MMHTLLSRLTLFLIIAFISSCAPSTTNVWDYYVKNNLEIHTPGSLSASKAKLLYRKQEYPAKAQLEMVVFKDDTKKCLVIGSHKIAKAFYLNDSLYHFDVSDLYSNVRGNDFIRQMGDLSIYFTNIPADKCEAFTSAVDRLKSDYMKAAVQEGAIAYVNYAITPEVFVSMEKKSTTQQVDNAGMSIWVGKRKHPVKMEDLMRVMQELKAFN